MSYNLALQENIVNIYNEPYDNLEKLSEDGINAIITNKVINNTLPNLTEQEKPLFMITGLPGSGKSTLVNSFHSKTQVAIISSDDVVKTLKTEQTNLFIIQNFIKNPEFIEAFNLKDEAGNLQEDKALKTVAGANNFVKNTKLFRLIEMQLFIYALESGIFSNKIVDLGGSVFLQPAVIKLCQLNNINVFNLEVETQQRVSNLVKDYIETINTPRAKRSNYNNFVHDNIENKDLLANFHTFLANNNHNYENIMTSISQLKEEEPIKIAYSQIYENFRKFDEKQFWRMNFNKFANHTIHNLEDLEKTLDQKLNTAPIVINHK